TACFAQLVDNIWMTSINIAVPHIAEEFNLHDGSQSWLVSAYTLTFGGFLLLAGVLSDRLGRRAMFTAGMLWMMAASIACGVAQTGVQCIIFRALQGLGAAASVPSAIGVLSNFFVGNEKHRALSMFGAAGAVGFVVGLILGGILSGTLGWRYVFYIDAPIIGILAITGWFSFPKEKPNVGGRKPTLDLLGAGLGTSGIVLMTFALSQSEVSGWNKPIVVVTLIVSCVHPLLPHRKILESHILFVQLPSFAGIWCSGFLLYCWWASVVYYLSLIAQEVLFLTPLNTGLYMIPMGAWGFVVSIATGRAVERFELKPLLVAGFFISAVGTLPAAFVKTGDLFWPLVFPTAIICVTGISIAYNVASIALVSAVPPVAKSLAGGLINTAFQIGSGFGLAITSLVYENVLQKQSNPNDPSSLMKGYQAALFTSCGLVGGSLILSILTVRNGQQTVSSGMMVH
ncbi:major facilitator superfamily domain-containing protein, partial [Lentinula raphanica]